MKHGVDALWNISAGSIIAAIPILLFANDIEFAFKIWTCIMGMIFVFGIWFHQITSNAD